MQSVDTKRYGLVSLETQGKIVRALQDQVFVRIGGNTQVEVDVRVISTTTKDLAAKVRAAEDFDKDQSGALDEEEFK